MVTRLTGRRDSERTLVMLVISATRSVGHTIGVDRRLFKISGIFS